MPDFPRAIRGYHPHQVDTFVARIEATLGRRMMFAPPVTPDEVSDIRFTVTLRGYSATAVDTALDGYRRELEAKSGAGRRRLPPAEADRLTGLIRNVQFSTTRLSEGYDERDVDAFLDRVTVGLRERRAWASDVRAARFTTSRMRPGYRQPEVDAFLEWLATEIERIRQG